MDSVSKLASSGSGSPALFKQVSSNNRELGVLADCALDCKSILGRESEPLELKMTIFKRIMKGFQRDEIYPTNQSKLLHRPY